MSEERASGGERGRWSSLRKAEIVLRALRGQGLDGHRADRTDPRRSGPLAIRRRGVSQSLSTLAPGRDPGRPTWLLEPEDGKPAELNVPIGIFFEVLKGKEFVYSGAPLSANAESPHITTSRGYLVCAVKGAD